LERIWSGNVDKPTLKPSIKTTCNNTVCHSFVNNGIIEFLGDCTHEFKNKKVELLNIETIEYIQSN